MNNVNNLVAEALVRTLNLENADQVKSESNLKEDLGLDSMSSLTFLMTLEETVDGFMVDPDTLDSDDLTSVASITAYVQGQTQMQAVSAA